MTHLENMAKVMLATGLIVGYGYMMEAFMAWYSANQYERFMIWNRMTGPYWYMYCGAHPLQRGDDQHALGQGPAHQRALPLLHLARRQRRACGWSAT